MSKQCVFIVEDEVLVAMALEDMLEDLGFAVDVANNLVDGLAAAESTGGVAAILDFHLHGYAIDPVCEVLRRRGIPYAIASGMDKEDLQAPVGNIPMLPKPYVLEDVRLVLEGMLKRPAAA